MKRVKVSESNKYKVVELFKGGGTFEAKFFDTDRGFSMVVYRGGETYAAKDGDIVEKSDDGKIVIKLKK